MLQLPPSLIRVPRAWLEHPLPLSGSGISPSLSFSTPDGRLLSLVFGGVDRWHRTPPVPCAGLTLDGFTLLCALISLTERRDGVTLTFNQLFRASTGSKSFCSAHHREKLKSTLATLESLTLEIAEATDSPLPAPKIDADNNSNERSARASGGLSYQPLLRIAPGVSRPVFGHCAPALVIHFAPAFLDLFNDPRCVAPFDFSSFLALRSRLARSIFPALSSWAHYNRAHAARPFRITFARLISHLGSPIPRFRSQRRAFFFGHRATSLFDDLLHLSTPHGFLHLRIEDASSVDDDCLCVWFENRINEEEIKIENKVISVPIGDRPRILGEDRAAILLEGNTPPENSTTSQREIGLRKPSRRSIQVDHIPTGVDTASISGKQSAVSEGLGHNAPVDRGTKSLKEISRFAPASGTQDFLFPFRHLKIYQAWNASGRTDADFVQRVRGASVTLTQDDLALLQDSKISPARCENFLLLSKKLLPTRTWLDLLGEAKYATLSHTPPKNPTGKLISEILASLRAGV